MNVFFIETSITKDFIITRGKMKKKRKKKNAKDLRIPRERSYRLKNGDKFKIYRGRKRIQDCHR